MSIFKRGQELKRGDLDIFLKNRGGNAKDAAEITYNIYDFTTGTEVLLSPVNRTPDNPSIGEYYASFFIPANANIGSYRIRWKFREYIGSQLNEIVQGFDVVDNATQILVLPGSSLVENDMIRSLRIMLRDNNPDRNYHFVPPAGEESISKFTRVFGFIWEDLELLEYLRIGLDRVNMYPPLTFYGSMDQLIAQMRPWRSVVLEAAMIYALTALAVNWVADEFEYSIGGVSLSIQKSGSYESLAENIQSRFSDDVVAAKETVKIVRGLRQSRFGIGIRSSFGPSVGRGALTPRRFLGI